MPLYATDALKHLISFQLISATSLRHPVSAVAQNSIAQEAWTTFLRDCNIELITNQNFALELVVLAFFCTIALPWRTRTFEGIHSDHTHTCLLIKQYTF